MPKVTVYVRKDDYSKWQAVKKKTELLANVLNRNLQEIHNEWDNIEDKELYGYKVVRDPEEVIKKLREVTVQPPSFKPCKHNADPKFCRFAKPGKPCK